MDWIKKHRFLTAIITFVLLIGIAGASGDDTSQKQSSDENIVDTSQSELSSVDSELQQSEEVKKAETESEKREETVSQKNAVQKARTYLDFAGFSRDGLVVQLEFDKFSNADAVYGADHAGADWNAEAAEKAKSYMEFSSFSRQGLIDQLVFDKFTPEQAAHGADTVGL